jgi:hypothetical protein
MAVTPDPFNGDNDPINRPPIDNPPPIDIGDPYPPTEPEPDPGDPIDGPEDTIIITPSPSFSYEYDIISLQSGVGSAFVAQDGSSLICNSSVAVFNRNNAFTAVNSSEAVLTNCCSYCANQGFVSWLGSSVNGAFCVASISANNYWVNGSSSMNLRQCASVFPVKNGINAVGSSSFTCTQMETMTAAWGAVSESTQIPVPAHFNSRQNSFTTNSSISLSTRQNAGLSGSVVSENQIGFIWSQIYSVNGGYATNPGTDIFADSFGASYRFVPRNHSTDYNSIFSNGTTVSLDASSLIAILSQSRQSYVSVKPPNWLYPPEDGSGNTGFGAAVTNLSLSKILTSLV